MDAAVFSLGDVFRSEHEDGEEPEAASSVLCCSESDQFEERTHAFPGNTEVRVREFAFHSHNANLLWPGSLSFADWLWQRPHILSGARVLELGSGTGALAVFLHKAMGCEVTTCDYDDAEIEQNIAHNCRLNGIAPLPHVRHTWGEEFPSENPQWNLIIASDILLYVKQYVNLIKTLKFLLGSRSQSVSPTTGVASSREYRDMQPKFILSWRRRIPKEEERKFFQGCEESQLVWKDLGSRVYEIKASEIRSS